MNDKHKNFSKAIKNLESNSAKGNLLSMFQLYENYTTGKNVEAVSEELSFKYFEMVAEKLPCVEFKIEDIHLYEFRRFRNLKIKFDRKLTVIIGDNGAGKTSIVEAVSKLLSWFSFNLAKDNANAKRIQELDINVNCNSYSEIIGNFKLGNKTPMDVSLAMPSVGYAGSISSTVAQAKRTGKIYREVASRKRIDLPFFAFYSVERSTVTLPKYSTDRTFSDLASSRFSALKDSLEASTQLDEFSRKYVELYNLAEAEKSLKISKKRDEISYLKNLIEKFSYENSFGKNSELHRELESAQKELTDLLGIKSARHSKMLEQVNYAIETLVPDVSNLHVDRSTGNQRVMVENFSNTVNITQLSQGQKSLVALSGDLALRLVTLNPDSMNALDTSGIVLIDEVELHLHPRWQQEIVLGLQKTFPNIQFILTTHSPQVLSTVDRNCIRQLCFDDNSQLTVVTPKFQTKGVMSSDILSQIMGTNSTPDKLEQAIWLNQFSRYLKLGDRESMADVFKKIVAHYGSDHPVVLDCESKVRISEMKERLRKE